MNQDSGRFFAQARDQAGQPVFLITDGRHSLTSSIRKEMPLASHVRLTKLTDKRQNNQNIERLNGTVVRSLNAGVTEIGQIYVIMPVPDSVWKAGK